LIPGGGDASPDAKEKERNKKNHKHTIGKGVGGITFSGIGGLTLQIVAEEV